MQLCKLCRLSSIVAGWSLGSRRHFRDRLQTVRLRDRRQGFGVQASWAPRLALLDLPLNHCLTMPHWHIASRRIGPYLGSDHRPVIADLHWDH
jgi:hypothetical protein